MLPNFLIIGVQKAATTWLAACLQAHPNVFMSKEKEIHFFDKYFDKGQAWYEAHFDNWAGEGGVGEATPDYISNPSAFQRIHDILGSNIKLIASLRHPVDRAYSGYWHRLRAGSIPVETDFLTFYRQNERFRSRGNYFVQLSRYLDCFPHENFLILIYEEITKDSRRVVRDCFNFLGVDTEFVPDTLSAKANTGGKDIGALHDRAWALRLMSRRVLIKVLPSRLRESIFATGRQSFERVAYGLGPKQKNFERLDEQLRQELISDYMADIKQLEDLLGRDLSIWYGTSRL